MDNCRYIERRLNCKNAGLRTYMGRIHKIGTWVNVKVITDDGYKIIRGQVTDESITELTRTL